MSAVNVPVRVTEEEQVFTGYHRHHGALMLLRWMAAFIALSSAALGCGDDTAGDASPISAMVRDEWKTWSYEFVAHVCHHEDACGTSMGAACVETGYRAADLASCDEGALFYIDNRADLEECIRAYPTSCAVTVDQACPTLAAHPFETICP